MLSHLDPSAKCLSEMMCSDLYHIRYIVWFPSVSVYLSSQQFKIAKLHPFSDIYIYSLGDYVMLFKKNFFCYG